MSREELINFGKIFFLDNDIQKSMCVDVLSTKLWECIYAKLGVETSLRTVYDGCCKKMVCMPNTDERSLAQKNYLSYENEDYITTYFESPYDEESLAYGISFKWDRNMFMGMYYVYDYFGRDKNTILAEMEKPYEDGDADYFLCIGYGCDYDEMALTAEEDKDAAMTRYKVLCYGALYLCYLSEDCYPYEEKLESAWRTVHPSWTCNGLSYIKQCMKDISEHLDFPQEDFHVIAPLVLDALFSFARAVNIHDKHDDDTGMAVSVLISKENLFYYDKNRDVMEDKELKEVLDAIYEFLKFPFTLPSGKYESCEEISKGFVGTHYVIAYKSVSEYSYANMARPVFLLGRALFEEGLHIMRAQIHDAKAA